MRAELFLTAKRFSTIFTPLHFVYFHVPFQILFCIEFLVKDGMNGARLSRVPSLSSEQVFCCKLYTGAFHHFIVLQLLRTRDSLLFRIRFLLLLLSTRDSVLIRRRWQSLPYRRSLLFQLLRCAICALAFVTFVDLCTFTTHIVAIVWKSRICVRNHQKNKGGLFLIQAYVGKSPP